MYAELLFGCCCSYGIISVNHGSVTRMISRHFCCQCYFCGLVCSCQTVVSLSTSVIKKAVFLFVGQLLVLASDLCHGELLYECFWYILPAFLSLKVFSYGIIEKQETV